MQAARFFEIEPDLVESIKSAPTPHIAHRRGQSASAEMYRERSGWKKLQLDEIRVIYRALLTQHSSVHALLKSTGGAGIIYPHKTDDLFGALPDGTGANVIGRLLKELRDTL
jgi:predicted NAD-dependent protein-ADP-ribosyltransferase YbiA (DUF1768 family)